MVGVGWGRVGFSLVRKIRDLARFLDECPLNIIPVRRSCRNFPIFRIANCYIIDKTERNQSKLGKNIECLTYLQAKQTIQKHLQLGNCS